jgi:CMP-N-acetylneuraminic acid synthetase
MRSKIEILAIIPARGGSKSIPHKNIRLFAGYPLISYSIAAGLQAKSVNRTVVSTDDEEIAQISSSREIFAG